MFVQILKTDDPTMTGVYQKIGVDYNKSYFMVGFGGDKILVQVDDHLIDLYPSKVRVDVTK